MNTAQYVPQTVWQGGRPGCFNALQPIAEPVPKQIHKSGAERICEHCNGTYKRGKHDTAKSFATRKYCNWTCANGARDKLRQERMDMVHACLPGTKNDVMAKVSLTWAEMERIMIYLVAGKFVVSEHAGQDGRIFRKVAP